MRNARMSMYRSFHVLSVLIASISGVSAQQCRPSVATVAPTDKTKTYVRKGPGEFGASRSGGKHQGTDIVVRSSYSAKSAYAVTAVAAGTIAYSQINGLPGKGFGNVIAIDHGNDCYSFYAHLANEPFTPLAPGGNLLRRVGDKVKTGQIIGYFVNIEGDVDSSGNAINHPVAPHQVHFSLIAAPSGRSGVGPLREVIMKGRAAYIDPWPMLKDLGYTIE